MIQFFYIDKQSKNIIGNENIYFDSNNKKLVLNNKNWYFMVLDDNIDSSDPSTAASLKTIHNLKEYIKEHYVSTEDIDKFSFDTSAIKALNDTDTSIIKHLESIDDLLGINNTKDDVINSYKEVEEFLESVSDSSNLLKMLTDMEDRINNNIPIQISQLENDLKYVTESTLDEKLANADLGGEKIKTINSSIETLFNMLDDDAYLDVSYIPNKIETVKNIEVGASLSDSYFKVTPGTAYYGYPEKTNNWVAGPISLTKPSLNFGYYNDVASCKFTLAFDEYPTLKTYLGKSQDKITISSTLYETIFTDIYGMYYWGWYSSNSKNDTSDISYDKLEMLQNFNDELIESNNNSAYVYVILPTTLKIKSVKVQNPFNNSNFYEIDNISIDASNIELTKLSSINKYNIWRCGKSNENADGTTTPNSQSIKITTELT